MFDKFKDTVKNLSEDVKSSVAEKEIEEDEIASILESFRLKLLESNVSFSAAESIEESVKDNLIGKDAGRFSVEDEVQKAIKQEIRETVSDNYNLMSKLEQEENPSIFFIGFNGSGKTTTLAKVSKYLEDKGFDSVFGAGDTFRAASMEQLEEHGEALDKKIVRHEYESDPAAVAYDTIEHGDKHGKISLIDTAGRSHSDRNLMDELEKMIEVNNPDITFLVVDALAGNDVVEQIKAYEGMFDAIIVTKMDIDEKGGTVISAARESGKPIAFIGEGQDYEDLKVFDKEEFIENLL